MMILNGRHISKSYGVEIILDDVDILVNRGDKIGIVGANGAGKSTLLKIIANEMERDKGELIVRSDLSIGYLKQEPVFEADTILEEVEQFFVDLNKLEKEIDELDRKIEDLTNRSSICIDDESKLELNNLIEQSHILREDFEARGGYTYKSHLRSMLVAMKFDKSQWGKNPNLLSGGEKTRLSLVCLLLQKPDLLLLDEPTNHLDINMIAWLESYLSSYKGSIITISHDRYFLNKIVNRIIEVENHKLVEYTGNYEAYVVQKDIKYQSKLKEYAKYEKEVKKQEALIREYKQRGTEKLAKRALSREKRLDKLEKIENPHKKKKILSLKFKEAFVSGKDVLKITDLEKSFGIGSFKRELFKNLNLDIKKGEKICIIGENGVGKTTLLRMIQGEVEGNRGSIELGHNVKIGYYDQNQDSLNPNNKLIDELHSEYRLYTQGELRGFLGKFLFYDDMINLPVRSLSGGEKARLSLLKLMLSGANLLLLDEPTNHLDIESKDIFEKAIADFDGTAIIISHDRYLLWKVPDKIVEMKKDGADVFLGKYDYYLEKKDRMGNEDVNTQIDRNYKEINPLSLNKNNEVLIECEDTDYINSIVSAKEKRQLQKEEERKRKKLEREKNRLEEEISNIEEEINKLEQSLCDEAILQDYETIGNIGIKLDVLRNELDEKYEKWLQYE